VFAVSLLGFILLYVFFLFARQRAPPHSYTGFVFRHWANSCWIGCVRWL
jgi:hypothetical protein